MKKWIILLVIGLIILTYIPTESSSSKALKERGDDIIYLSMEIDELTKRIQSLEGDVKILNSHIRRQDIKILLMQTSHQLKQKIRSTK